MAAPLSVAYTSGALGPFGPVDGALGLLSALGPLGRVIHSNLRGPHGLPGACYPSVPRRTTPTMALKREAMGLV